MDEKARKLAEENHNLIYSFLRKYRLSAEEYYGAAAVGLCRAAERYRPEKSSFSTFAYLCMLNMVRHEARGKKKVRRIPADKLVSLDGERLYKDGETFRLMDVIPSGEDVEADILDSCAWENALKRLSGTEREAVLLLLQGYIQAEVGRRIRRSQAQVSRIEKKMKRYLEEERNGNEY